VRICRKLAGEVLTDCVAFQTKIRSGVPRSPLRRRQALPDAEAEEGGSASNTRVSIQIRSLNWLG